MNFADYLSESCIRTGFTAESKEAVLREICRLARNHPLMKNFTEEEIYRGLSEREKIGSTGLGRGIAIPHCRLDGLDDFVSGVLIVPEGVNFHSVDGKKTFIFAFIIAPKEKRNEHIRILAGLSGFLRTEEKRNEVMAEESVSGVFRSFRSTATRVIEVRSREEHYLITVIVQTEQHFFEILNVFTELERSHITVLDGSNAGKYLYSLPLFTQFWSDEQLSTQKVILAVVRREFANEALNKVNEIIAKRKGKPGILVMMQDLPFVNGSLEI